MIGTLITKNYKMELSIIKEKIFTIRGYKVMLDFDLAELYGVETRVLKQAVRRNIDISIVRAFVMYRKHLADYGDLKEQIAKLEKEMNVKFKDIHQALNYLLQKDKVQIDQQNRERIGFKTNDKKPSR